MSQSDVLKMAAKSMKADLTGDEQKQFDEIKEKLDVIFKPLYDGSDETVLPVVAIDLMAELLEHVE